MILNLEEYLRPKFQLAGSRHYGIRHDQDHGRAVNERLQTPIGRLVLTRIAHGQSQGQNPMEMDSEPHWARVLFAGRWWWAYAIAVHRLLILQD